MTRDGRVCSTFARHTPGPLASTHTYRTAANGRVQMAQPSVHGTTARLDLDVLSPYPTHMGSKLCRTILGSRSRASAPMIVLAGLLGCTPMFVPAGSKVTMVVESPNNRGTGTDSSGTTNEHAAGKAATIARADGCRDSGASTGLAHSSHIAQSPAGEQDIRVWRDELRALEERSVLVRERLAALQSPSAPAGSGSGSDASRIAKVEAILRVGVRPGLPPGTVYVNHGPALGKTPMSISVRPGKHFVRVVWPNGGDSTRQVHVRRGDTNILKFE